MGLINIVRRKIGNRLRVVETNKRIVILHVAHIPGRNKKQPLLVGRTTGAKVKYLQSIRELTPGHLLFIAHEMMLQQYYMLVLAPDGTQWAREPPAPEEAYLTELEEFINQNLDKIKNSKNNF